MYVYTYVCMYMYLLERQSNLEIFHLPIHSPNADLSWAKTRIQELHLGVLYVWQGPKYLLPPQVGSEMKEPGLDLAL